MLAMMSVSMYLYNLIRCTHEYSGQESKEEAHDARNRTRMEVYSVLKRCLCGGRKGSRGVV